MLFDLKLSTQSSTKRSSLMVMSIRLCGLVCWTMGKSHWQRLCEACLKPPANAKLRNSVYLGVLIARSSTEQS
jgi:hypothetical protein